MHRISIKPGDFEAAVEAAKEYAAENYGTTEAEWAGCENPDPLAYQHPGTGTNCISFDAFLYPREVLVVVPLRQQPSLFGGVFGYEGVSIGALAQARLDPGGQRVCTFCVLGEDASDIQNGEVSVTGGNMWFNGDLDIGSTGGASSVLGTVVGDDGTTFEDGGNTYVAGNTDTSKVKGNIAGGAATGGGPACRAGSAVCDSEHVDRRDGSLQ